MSDKKITSVTEEFVYECWDCPACGEGGIRGDHVKCPKCTRTRAADTRFYRSDNGREVVRDQEQIRVFAAGEDWSCAYCEKLNRAVSPKCQHCGAQKTEDARGYAALKAGDPKRAATQDRASGEMASKEASSRERSSRGAPSAKGRQPGASRGSGGWGEFAKAWAILLTIGGVLAVGGYKTYRWGQVYFGPKQVTYEVVEREWRREIHIKRYELETRQAWADDLYGDEIVEVSREQKIRSYDKVPDGFETESYQDSEYYTTQEVQEKWEKVQAGSKEECETKYVSLGNGAGKNVKTCHEVPVYKPALVRKLANVTKTRPVTRTRQVQKYKDVPVYGTYITYRSAAYQGLPPVTLKGSDESPRWPKYSLGKGYKGKPDLLDNKFEGQYVRLRKVSAEDRGPRELLVETSLDRYLRDYVPGTQKTLTVEYDKGVVLQSGELAVQTTE